MRWEKVCGDLLELVTVFCSTNGTVINLSKVVKKQAHVLQNRDVIYFVYRKSEPEQSKFTESVYDQLFLEIF